MNRSRRNVTLGVICIALGFAAITMMSGNDDRTRRMLSGPVAYDQSENRPLPLYAQKMKDVWEPMAVNDQPFFWYIMKTGGLTFQKICANCLNLVSASSRGMATSGPLTTVLHADGGFYLNVDLGTEAGIDDAASKNLVPSGLADIIFSHHLVYATDRLFDSAHKARMMVMFRNPTKRAIDSFYYAQRAAWTGSPPYDTDLALMSLTEYAASDKVVENMIVRSLVEKPATIDVTKDDVDYAKEILRRKFMVGILDWVDMSFARYEKFVGWWDTYNVFTDPAMNACHYTKINNGDQIGNHPKWHIGDNPHTWLTIRNWADTELYAYAKHLFAMQAKLVGDA